ncbi:MAG: deoxyribose-phosphate aldolase [Clostridia bacterium]|nr:deoxyribose-phosphate aldolase [Clostridia bacterium]
MTASEILSHCDHTLLKPDATFADVRLLIDDAISYNTASVCIAPCFVREAARYTAGRVKICTVIGFPNGYSTVSTKCYEAREAAYNGADEIDMVINLANVKAKNYGAVADEINSVRLSCSRVVKVIVETCLLTEEEKITLCEIISRSDAEYIKTSTGFSAGGATKEDVKLFKDHISGGTLIKAAGGISTLEDAEEFIALGADRIGCSRIVGLVKENDEHDSAQ